MCEVVHLAAKAVDEHQWRTRTFIEVMDAGAIDLNETAARRQHLLDPSRRPRRENGKADGQNKKGGYREADNPGKDGHFLIPDSKAT